MPRNCPRGTENRRAPPPHPPANRRRVLHSFFAYWTRKGAIDGNPAAQIDKPAVAHSLPGILRADDAVRLLHAAQARDVPALAVALFAGIRTAELENLRCPPVPPAGSRGAVAHSKKPRPCFRLPRSQASATPSSGLVSSRRRPEGATSGPMLAHPCTPLRIPARPVRHSTVGATAEPAPPAPFRLSGST